ARIEVDDPDAALVVPEQLLVVQVAMREARGRRRCALQAADEAVGDVPQRPAPGRADRLGRPVGPLAEDARLIACVVEGEAFALARLQSLDPGRAPRTPGRAPLVRRRRGIRAEIVQRAT